MAKSARASPVACSLCQIECPNQLSFTAHIRGKKHVQKLAATTAVPQVPTAGSSSVTVLFVTCPICPNKKVGGGPEGWKSHMKSMRHDKIYGYAQLGYDFISKISKQAVVQVEQKKLVAPQPQSSQELERPIDYSTETPEESWSQQVPEDAHWENLETLLPPSDLSPPQLTSDHTALMRTMATPPFQPDPPYPQPRTKRCEDCDRLVYLSGWEGHVKSPMHAKNVSRLAQPSLGPAPPTYDSLPKVSGRQAIEQKQTKPETPPQQIHLCMCCNANVPQQGWVQHLASISHRTNLRALLTRPWPPPARPVPTPATLSKLKEHFTPSQPSPQNLLRGRKRCEDCDRSIHLSGWEDHLKSPRHAKNASPIAQSAPASAPLPLDDPSIVSRQQAVVQEQKRLETLQHQSSQKEDEHWCKTCNTNPEEDWNQHAHEDCHWRNLTTLLPPSDLPPPPLVVDRAILTSVPTNPPSSPSGPSGLQHATKICRECYRIVHVAGWEDHISGSIHMKNVARLARASAPAPSPKASGKQIAAQEQKRAKMPQQQLSQKREEKDHWCMSCNTNVPRQYWNQHIFEERHCKNLKDFTPPSYLLCSRVEPIQLPSTGLQQGSPSSQPDPPNPKRGTKRCEQCDRVIHVAGWESHIKSLKHMKKAGRPVQLTPPINPQAQPAPAGNTTTIPVSPRAGGFVPGARSPYLNTVLGPPVNPRSFPIPEEIKAAFKPEVDDARAVHDAIARKVPSALSSRTYEEFWRVLLFVEEIQAKRSRSQHNVFSSHLQKRGIYYCFEVPSFFKHRELIRLGESFWVRLHSSSANATTFQGIVHHVQEGHIYLRFGASFQNERNPLFELEHRLDWGNFRRMHHALAISLEEQGRRRILSPQYEDFEAVPAVTREGLKVVQDRTVNEIILSSARQLWAIASVTERPSGSPPLVILGAPGTGKTTTLIEAIRQILLKDRNAKVLACAPSDAAADVIAKLLVDLGRNAVFRLNAPTRSKSELPSVLAAFSCIKQLQTTQAAFAGEIVADLDYFDCPSTTDLMKYRVIVSTCFESHALATKGVPKGHFSHILINNSGQGLEPELMIPIKTMTGAATNIVLFGDPNQLGPKVHSPIAKKLEFGKSYLERLLESPFYDGETTPPGVAVVTLKQNFTSHPTILKFPNETFYNGHLTSRESGHAVKSLQDWAELPTKGFPIIFHAVQGTCQQYGSSLSYSNSEEVSVVMNYMRALQLKGLTNFEIGILSPYESQCDRIRSLLSAGLSKQVCSIGTIEELQNQKRKVIIVSTVRSTQGIKGAFDKKEHLGDITQAHHLNMIITRAQALLIVIGNPSVLGCDSKWRDFLSYIYLGGGWHGLDIEWDPEDDYDSDGSSDGNAEA